MDVPSLRLAFAPPQYRTIAFLAVTIATIVVVTSGCAERTRTLPVDVIAEVKALGGTVEVDEVRPSKPVIAIDLSFTNADNAATDYIKDLATLRSLM